MHSSHTQTATDQQSDLFNLFDRPIEGAAVQPDSTPLDVNPSSMTKQIKSIPVTSISPNPWQPRTVFRDEAIQGLAESIGASGLQHPVQVRKTSRGKYELITGELRWRAHALLEKKTIDAMVLNVSDEQMGPLALVENLQRSDLSDFEVGVAIKRHADNWPNRTDFARVLGISRTDLYRYLAFDDLPSFVRDDLHANPQLLSRKSAEAVKSVLSNFGDIALDKLESLWPSVVDGKLCQSKLAKAIKDAIAADLAPAKPASTSRPVISGKTTVGTIRRDQEKIRIDLSVAKIPAPLLDRAIFSLESVLTTPIKQLT